MTNNKRIYNYMIKYQIIFCFKINKTNFYFINSFINVKLKFLFRLLYSIYYQGL